MGRCKLTLALACMLACGLAIGWPPVRSEGAFYGSIEGTVWLQGRDSVSQVVEVSLDDRQQMAYCNTAGNFQFEYIQVGPHTIEISMIGFLPARRSVMVQEGSSPPLPNVLLLGGDVDTEGNSEERIDVADLALMGSCFNTTPPQHGHADLNDDNIIDIYDLVMIGANFGRTESPWPE